jgi:hypothetical protein
LIIVWAGALPDLGKLATKEYVCRALAGKHLETDFNLFG